MDDQFDIEEKAQKMECTIQNPISILPNNFRNAKSKEELFYGVTEVAAIAYLRNKGLETSMRDCDEKFGLKSKFSEFNTLNILIKSTDSSVTEIISDLLITLLERNVFPKTVEIKVFKKIGTKYKEKSYKGPSNGLNELPKDYWEFN